MKKKSIQIAVLLLTILICASSTVSAQVKQKEDKSQKRSVKGAIQLFNGKDLNNWAFHLRDASVDPAKVFTVMDGVIHITGNPFGYMRTKETYSDYILHVEYRWPAEATNSGVFIHAQTPDTIWIRSFECQLAAGSAGDFICMNGTDMNERTDKSTRVIRKKSPSSEKAVVEWNTMEIICKANTIEVSVNGVVQNKGTGLSDNKGHICLQSEGKDIQFRNVFVTKLKK